MSAEDIYIKNIESGIRALRLRSKTPLEANVVANLNRLKTINEGLFDDYLSKYNKALNEYDKHNNGNKINL